MITKSTSRTRTRHPSRLQHDRDHFIVLLRQLSDLAEEIVKNYSDLIEDQEALNSKAFIARAAKARRDSKSKRGKLMQRVAHELRPEVLASFHKASKAIKQKKYREIASLA